MSHDGLGWLSDRQRDGGVDEIPLPPLVTGTLHLCGKHAVSRAVSDTTRDWTVVCLTERHELIDRYPAYVSWLEEISDDRAIWWPIPDLHAPPPERMLPFVDDLVARLHRGAALLVHCGAGMGRAGTIAVGILVRLGFDTTAATAAVAGARPGAGPEVGPQLELVHALAARRRRAVPRGGSPIAARARLP